jgi:glycosyltransferase involved in cell wall biosynthesis
VPAARRFTELANVLLPGKRRAAILLAANQRTVEALPRVARARTKLLVENGVDLATWDVAVFPDALRTDAAYPSQGPRRPAKFVFMGSLVDWKGVDFAIEALAMVPDAELHVIGSGPMLEPWRRLAYSRQVGDRVHFLGWLTQPLCAAQLSSATALVLPSVFECGGAVVLEAMAVGRPVIATQWGGPVDYITEGCGILIPPQSRAAMIAGFADAMRRLADDPELCGAMGRAARRRLVEHFTWDKKIDAMLDIYRSAQASSATVRGSTGNFAAGGKTGAHPAPASRLA